MTKDLQHFHFEILNSTQTKAFEIWEEGSAAPPFLVTTDVQTQGRGRLGRTWHSERGRSLIMSLAVELSSQSLSGLSLVVGLAALSVIPSAHRMQLKWPNDLMMNDAKVGGILVETRTQAGNELAQVVIGVGLNLLSQQNANFSGIQRMVHGPDMAQAILKILQQFKSRGFSFFQADYSERMWRKNAEVDFQIGNQKQRVKVLGVNENGLLLTEEQGSLNLSDSGEILID